MKSNYEHKPKHSIPNTSHVVINTVTKLKSELSGNENVCEIPEYIHHLLMECVRAEPLRVLICTGWFCYI